MYEYERIIASFWKIFQRLRQNVEVSFRALQPFFDIVSVYYKGKLSFQFIVHSSSTGYEVYIVSPEGIKRVVFISKEEDIRKLEDELEEYLKVLILH